MIKEKKTRESNMELLRIVAMTLVLVVHAGFYSLGTPVLEDLQADAWIVFFRCLSESFSIVCVNVFVLISGWYGIHAKASKLAGFLFQVLCVSMGVYIIMLFIGKTNVMTTDDWRRFFLFDNYWFVRAYIILYIFTPLLNAFAEKSSKRGLELFLLSFFVWQFVREFMAKESYFIHGNSPLSFMGLYLLARYLRLCPNRFTQFHRRYDLFVYLSVTLVTTAIAMACICAGMEYERRFYAYSSPLVVIASVYVLLFFSKISIKSKVINWVATSCFAIYIVHCSPFLFPIYSDHIHEWFLQCSTGIFLLNTVLWMVVFFVASILLDKIRIVFWNGLVWLWNKAKGNVGSHATHQ